MKPYNTGGQIWQCSGWADLIPQRLCALQLVLQAGMGHGPKHLRSCPSGCIDKNERPCEDGTFPHCLDSRDSGFTDIMDAECRQRMNQSQVLSSPSSRRIQSHSAASPQHAGP